MKTPNPCLLLARWIAIPLLALAMLWFLNLAAFHWWASWGPPNQNPEWDKSWSIRFLFLGLASAGSCLWLIFGPLFRRNNE